tara:strand:+ start:1186 stop:1353 length:168 start_codon:yes stop_codon:yes gene_type:complete
MNKDKVTDIVNAVLTLQGLMLRHGLQEEFGQLDNDMTTFAVTLLDRVSGYKRGEE